MVGVPCMTLESQCEKSGLARAQDDLTRTVGRSRCSYMVDNTKVANHCFGRYLGGFPKEDNPFRAAAPFWNKLLRI